MQDRAFLSQSGSQLLPDVLSQTAAAGVGRAKGKRHKLQDSDSCCYKEYKE